MKFFKHFTDANRGQSLQGIAATLGMEGIGQWWTLVEICAEKLEKDPSEEYAEKHCVFTFNVTYLANVLRMKPKRFTNVLGTFQEHSLLSFERYENIVVIKIPKLLESLDRDSRRARKVALVPRKSAPKRKNKEKEVDVAPPAKQVFIHPTKRLELLSDERSLEYIQALEQLELSHLKNLIPEIRIRFNDSLEKFAEWANALVESAEKKCSSRGERERYITVAIKKEIAA